MLYLRAQFYRNKSAALLILLLISAEAYSAENFPLDATWSGATQWMSGVDNSYEAFGGSIAKGVDFLGSNVITSDYVPVEIVFESDSALWTLVQVFRRGPFTSFGVGKFPGSAWDITDPVNPRRLNLCIVEYDDGADPLPPPNFRWDPDTSQYGKYEYLLVMNSNYDSTGTTYAGINILANSPDVLYAWWPRLAAGHTFLETIPSSLFISPRINLRAAQVEYDVHLKWLTPGPSPNHYELFMGVGQAPDSLLATLSATDTLFIHSNVDINQNYHYILNSKGVAGNDILSSREKIITVRALPAIASVFPVSQELQADTLTDIVVTFDSVMNPTTINSSTFKIFGHWSGPKFGTYQMENGNTRVRFTPNEPFSAGEWVLVNLTKSIETANGTSQPSGYAWSFWVRTRPASIKLVKIGEISARETGEGPIQCYGAYGGDINDDGYSDISIVNEISDDVRVFLNDGLGGYNSFTIYPFAGGGAPSPNDGSDFNSDGKIDMAVGASQSNHLRIIINNGSGGFNTPNSYTTGNNNRGVAVLDLNGDGHDDVATSNRGANKVYTLLNSGDGTFGPAVQYETGSNGEFACASGDANNDGILDLFVGAQSAQDMILLLGNGNGGLVYSATVNSGGETWMIATGDVNLDGNIDVVSSNSGSNNASVIFGDGLGGLSQPVTYPTPPFPIAIDLGDIDGDGDLEMVTSSYSGGKFRVFENDGTGNYINPLDYPAPLTASCMTLHDRNRDGVMDLTGIDETADVMLLFEPLPFSCCVGLRGDLNGDDVDINVLDLTFIVDFIFRGSGNPGSCHEESDVNGDGSNPNVVDLTFMVDRIFRGGVPPPPCP